MTESLSFNATTTYSNNNTSFLQRLERKAPREHWVSKCLYHQLQLPTVHEDWNKGPTSYSLALLERRSGLMASCSMATLSWTACHTALLVFPWADVQIYTWRSLWDNNENHHLWYIGWSSGRRPFPRYNSTPFSTACQNKKDKNTVDVNHLSLNSLQNFICLASDSLLGYDRPQSTFCKLQKQDRILREANQLKNNTF